MNQLPDELLIEIFLAHPPYRCKTSEAQVSDPVNKRSSSRHTQRRPPWVFTHVCRRWRRIALSLPDLWCHLPAIDLAYGLEGNPAIPSYLSLSKSQPLSIYARFGSLAYNKEVFELLENYVERWEDLTLFVPCDGSFPGLMHLKDRFKSLRSCHIICDWILSITSDAFSEAHNLEELSVLVEGNTFLSTMPRFPASLRKLHIHYPGYNAALEILAATPQLVECYFSDSQEGYHWEYHLARDVKVGHVIMPNLESLRLDDDWSGSSHDKLVSSLTLPKLRNLDLSFKGARDRAKFSDVIDMLRRSTPHLKTLGLDVNIGTSLNPETLRTLLALVPELELLRWNNHQPSDENGILGVFCDPTLVPRLCTLIFDSYGRRVSSCVEKDILREIIRERGCGIRSDVPTPQQQGALAYLTVRRRMMKKQDHDELIGWPQREPPSKLDNISKELQGLFEIPPSLRKHDTYTAIDRKLEWVVNNYHEVPIPFILHSELHLTLNKLVLRGHVDDRSESNWIPALEPIIDYWKNETREYLTKERWMPVNEDLLWVAPNQCDVYDLLWDISPPYDIRFPPLRRKIPMEWINVQGGSSKLDMPEWEYADLPPSAYDVPSQANPIGQRITGFLGACRNRLGIW